ncbi:Serine/threonine protein phosphatase [Handroanthus impetiginosus]|uniref:protein-serine/threonine phosphatase n=1 Tax=Handroanthus impetiginosus TaxID=429701 RepID=A0A2G9GG54_9LAMI|nr:Serine/threonine protein phosphatase [Handroanthus impetiginosus]
MTANDEPILIASVSNSICLEMTEMPTNPSSSLAFTVPDRAEKLGGPIGNGALKRKRPPKIEIPKVLREISTDIFKGFSAQGQGDGSVCFTDSGIGVFSLKGKKKFMEDAHKVFSSSNGNKGFFGVYDGHGGRKAAEFVAENLHLRIFEMLESSTENTAKEEAVKVGYLKTDEEFLKQGLGSGTCCVTALIEGGEMIVSNVGDCRAVLCRGGVAEALTKDHSPAQEDERRRIEDKGGYVEIHRGTWRVHGTLAVSRSIGDAHLKDWVMAEPDSKVICLTPEMEYLVLASDGLWDEVSNQEAVDIVMQSCSSSKKQLLRSSPEKKSPTRVSLVKSRRLFNQKMSTIQPKRSEDELSFENVIPPSKSRRISLVKQMKIKTHFPSNENEALIENPSAYGGLLAACKELVNLAVSRGSLDDITVMIVDLNHYKVVS